MFTLQFVSFLVRGIPPVTHTPSSQSEWVRGGGCCGGGQGWAWLGGLSLPEAAYTGGGRGGLASEAGRLRPDRDSCRSLSVLSLPGQFTNTHHSFNHTSLFRPSQSHILMLILFPSIRHPVMFSLRKPAGVLPRVSLWPLFVAGGETLLTHKKAAREGEEEGRSCRCAAETFLPSSKGKSSFSSFLGGGLVNNGGGGERGKKGSESESWHAESQKTAQSCDVGCFRKNLPEWAFFALAGGFSITCALKERREENKGGQIWRFCVAHMWKLCLPPAITLILAVFNNSQICVETLFVLFIRISLNMLKSWIWNWYRTARLCNCIKQGHYQRPNHTILWHSCLNFCDI